MIKLTSIYCFLALCATLTYADIGSAVGGQLSHCFKLKEEVMGKIKDIKADWKQATCAGKKSGQMVMDAMKGTEMEKNCGPKCERLMTMMQEDEEIIGEELAKITGQLTIKEWEKEVSSKYDELKAKNDGRAKEYETEGGKCEECGKKHVGEAEKMCEEMKKDVGNMVNAVKEACKLN